MRTAPSTTAGSASRICNQARAGEFFNPLRRPRQRMNSPLRPGASREFVLRRDESATVAPAIPPPPRGRLGGGEPNPSPRGGGLFQHQSNGALAGCGLGNIIPLCSPFPTFPLDSRLRGNDGKRNVFLVSGGLYPSCALFCQSHRNWRRSAASTLPDSSISERSLTMVGVGVGSGMYS